MELHWAFQGGSKPERRVQGTGPVQGEELGIGSSGLIKGLAILPAGPGG